MELEDIKRICRSIEEKPFYEKFPLTGKICKLDYTKYRVFYSFSEEIIIVLGAYDEEIDVFRVSEYGKTWALTKEELLLFGD